MLPEFPEFKKLELSDKEEIENFTSKFPPYSDFNFVSMWCWDIRGEMRISKLNNNLVVRFTDYLTGNPFFSFLGDNMVNETAKTLLEFSKKYGLPAMLKLVSEISIKGLDVSKFKIEEDLNNFDYIYKILDIKDLKGNKFNSKRGEINRLLRKYAGFRIEVIDITKNKEIMLSLTKNWFEHKIAVSGYKDFINEMFAIDKLLTYNIKSSSLFTLGLFLGDKLIGYVVNEILSNGHNIIHFEKTDLDYNGVHSFLIKKNATFLVEKGVTYINYEQDLGLPALKRSKESFRPTYFLKKFIIKLR